MGSSWASLYAVDFAFRAIVSVGHPRGDVCRARGPGLGRAEHPPGRRDLPGRRAGEPRGEWLRHRVLGVPDGVPRRILRRTGRTDLPAAPLSNGEPGPGRRALLAAQPDPNLRGVRVDATHSR